MNNRCRRFCSIARKASQYNQKDLLEKATLPRKYPRMTAGEQKQARLNTLTAWYDEDQPDVLCTCVDSFVAAHFLWVEFYYKPVPINHGIYYYDDPLCKYDMVRMALSDPLLPEEPAKSLVHAPRRLGKTQTLIIEMAPLIAITRPFSQIMVSELNQTRTEEEIAKIRFQVEFNERIHADFGGRGVLFPTPRMGVKKWRDDRLDFVHLPNCSILGTSIESAQRGRGPVFGIIDDPEDRKTSFSRKWRRDFFEFMFSTFMPMFARGGKVLWIGTILHTQSALAQALGGQSERSKEGSEASSIRHDERFDDWNKRKFPMIFEIKDKKYSQQPQRITPEGFDAKCRALGRSSAMAEFQGDPQASGSLVFEYSERQNGFMRCKGEDGHYFLDLGTWKMEPWNDFVDGLAIAGGGDLADGQSVDSDFGALAFLGTDKNNVKWVVDAFADQIMVEYLVQKAFKLAVQWDCQRITWDQVGLQKFIVRNAERHAVKLRKKGKRVPVMVGSPAYHTEKTQRIINTLQPWVDEGRIKFLQFTPVTDPDGVVHRPAVVSNRNALITLTELVAQMTDQKSDGLDLLDALEYAVTGSSTVLPREAKPEASETEQLLDKMASTGLDLRAAMPVGFWSPEMLKEHEQQLYIAFVQNAVTGGWTQARH